MKKILIVLVLLMFILSNKNIFGENFKSPNVDIDTTAYFKIEVKDGSRFIGNILHKDSINLVIKTASIPRIELELHNIKRIKNIDKADMIDGTYWFPNPNPTRYLYVPSAFTLKKGEGYYQNTWLTLNSFNVGITDNMSIGGGVEFFTTVNALRDHNISPIFFITPKFGFQVSENFHAGGGIWYINLPSVSISK